MDAIMRRLFCMPSLVVAFATTLSLSAAAERVNVKYREEVNLAPFECTPITRSSFVQRVCYDRDNSYMLVDLKGTYYHYCEIDGETVAKLLHADSVGWFFNANVKGRFDCRTHHVPNY
jgi:KTSC domain